MFQDTSNQTNVSLVVVTISLKKPLLQEFVQLAIPAAWDALEPLIINAQNVIHHKVYSCKTISVWQIVETFSLATPLLKHVKLAINHVRLVQGLSQKIVKHVKYIREVYIVWVLAKIMII